MKYDGEPGAERKGGRYVNSMMTPREVVRRTIRFEGADRIPYELPEPWGSDFAWVGMTPSPDARPREGVDEWGAVWENIGVSSLGEVKDYPLKEWDRWDALRIPDIREPRRWTVLQGARERAGDRFLIGSGLSLYERAHFIRGLENVWMDIYLAPDALGRLIDVLVEMNLYAIERYAEIGVDGLMFCDDWGLQDRLMISPDSWRAIWKPRYARVYQAAHEAGLLTLLHSCGNITSILDDLIEIGLDVIQMDQQENMGLDVLGETFGGRITFWCPVDIQQTMVCGTTDEIRAYARRMVRTLGRPNGGFIARWYSDPAGAGHRQEAIEAMCDEFVRLSHGARREVDAA
ncbi:MAG: uroporphyrinogen decarboxylase family protein [Anaerolineae bacterium]